MRDNAQKNAREQTIQNFQNLISGLDQANQAPNFDFESLLRQPNVQNNQEGETVNLS